MTPQIYSDFGEMCSCSDLFMFRTKWFDNTFFGISINAKTLAETVILQDTKK